MKLVDLFVEFYKQHPYILTLSIVLSAMSQGIETILIPMSLSEIFTNVDNPDKLVVRVIWYLIAFIVNKLLALGASYFDQMIEPHLTKFMTDALVDAVFRKFEYDHIPVEITLVTEKIRGIRIALENFIAYVFVKIIPTIFVLLGATVRIFYISFALGAMVIVGILILGVIMYFQSRPETTLAYKDEVSVFLDDIFQNIDFITTSEFGKTQAVEDIEHLVANLRNKRVEYQINMTENQLVIVAVACLLYVANTILLIKLLNSKKISVKQFESSLLTLARMYELIFDIAYHIPEFVGDIQSLVYLENFVSILFSFPDKVGTDDTELGSGIIRFDHVTFGYNDEDIYTDMSMTIEEGKAIALCGQSGCGKSTFVKLILDMLQPKDGKIYIDGRPTSQMTTRLLKHSISSISQNTTSLLRTTIYKNITYGIPETSNLKAKVDALVNEYNLDDVFGSIGFLHYEVEKGGTSLSGGQKQIVHLLHAVLNENARIFILDEPSSALDIGTKQCVFSLIHRLAESGKTVLIITHDTELRDICDDVIYFTKGANPERKA